MDGIFCIDKPGDHTSFDVIARVRGILKQKKVGHGGTLDPMATGVLPIFLGKATRCCDILPNGRKRYIADCRLGIGTDTQDITGTVVERCETPVTRGDLEAALRRFDGGYEQLPPMYSALQVNGQRLYDLARQGISVQREKRTIQIYQLRLLSFDAPRQEFSIEAECSKGAYIRTLCWDIAKAAGSTAVLTVLRRTESSGFTLEDCVTIEQLQSLAAENRAETVLRPVERVFESLPRVFLSGSQERMLRNGVKMDLNRVRKQTDHGPVAVYGPEGFVAWAMADPEAALLQNVKVF